MATEAQTAANRANARRSTGPRSAEGKAASSANARKLGLFSSAAFVRPGEEDEYTQLSSTLRNTLAPGDPVEETFAAEIVRATWRLRCCAVAESSFAANLSPDATVDPAVREAIDRARAESHRLLNRSLHQLRRLQTERAYRNEFLGETFDPAPYGLAEYHDVFKTLPGERQWQLRNQNALSNRVELELKAMKTAGDKWLADQRQTRAARAESNSTNQTQSAPVSAPPPAPVVPPETPRSSPCPCGSGEKYKRCCGRTAAPVLSHAA